MHTQCGLSLRTYREMFFCTAVIIPGSYICSYEDLEDIGFELGKVRKALFLYYTKVMVINIHEEKNPEILNIRAQFDWIMHTYLFHHGMQGDGRKFELPKHHCEYLAISKQEYKKK